MNRSRNPWKMAVLFGLVLLINPVLASGVAPSGDDGLPPGVAHQDLPGPTPAKPGVRMVMCSQLDGLFAAFQDRLHDLVTASASQALQGPAPPRPAVGADPQSIDVLRFNYHQTLLRRSRRLSGEIANAVEASVQDYLDGIQNRACGSIGASGDFPPEIVAEARQALCRRISRFFDTARNQIFTRIVAEAFPILQGHQPAVAPSSDPDDDRQALLDEFALGLAEDLAGAALGALESQIDRVIARTCAN